VVTGAPLIYASSQFQDHSELGFDDCPATPGDDDDDEDDKDKVSAFTFSKVLMGKKKKRNKIRNYFKF